MLFASAAHTRAFAVIELGTLLQNISRFIRLGIDITAHNNDQNAQRINGNDEKFEQSLDQNTQQLKSDGNNIGDTVAEPDADFDKCDGKTAYEIRKSQGHEEEQTACARAWLEAFIIQPRQNK